MSRSDRLRLQDFAGASSKGVKKPVGRAQAQSGSSMKMWDRIVPVRPRTPEAHHEHPAQMRCEWRSHARREQRVLAPQGQVAELHSVAKRHPKEGPHQ